MSNTNFSLGASLLMSSYEKAVESIQLILKKRYRMSASDASNAIKNSPLKDIFAQDEEMASHTSNESWAKDVHDLWMRQCKP